MENRNDKISECLAELNNVTATLEPDSDLRRRLEEIIGELNAPRVSDNDDFESSESKIAVLINQLEVEHPRITNILNDLMLTLSGIGI